MKSGPSTPHPLERKLDITSYLPRLWQVSLLVVLVAALFLLAWPLASASYRRAWTGGAVTNHHRLVEARCSSCHTGSFTRVADGACTACHEARAHTAALPGLVAAHPELAVACAACHREHHGAANLVPPGSALCTPCHARAKALEPTRRLPSFAGLAQHPELVIDAYHGDPPTLGPVALGTPGLRVEAQLKFSHALHLGLAEETLTCASCHAPAGADLAPVAYERHCARCHALALDGTPVPHASPDQVFQVLRGEAALAAWRARAHTPPSADDARELERALFTEGGACLQCHDVHANDAAGEGASRFRVEPPRSARRLPGARFDHDAHRLSRCDSCHRGIADSRSAADVLLPSISVCRDCHADPGVPDKVSSPCLECHRYHDPGAAPVHP